MIINATNIGENLSGLGRFSLYIAKYFLNDYQVVINKKSINYFSNKELNKLKIVSEKFSPDFGFKGHFRRFLFSNRLNNDSLFTLSQMEINFFNKNQIVVVHDLIPLLFPSLHKNQYHFFKYLLPYGLKKVKKIITPSFHTKELILKYYNLDKNKIEVIHNGIELPKIDKIETKENYILYVGRDSETKNLNRLIEAFKKLSFNNSVKLYLVGVKKEFKIKNVKSLGFVDDKELDLLYRKAKFLILPSLYEGFGYPTIEAMARGTAVIVSNKSSLPEICGENALYVNPYDIEDMFKKMELLLNNTNLRKKLELSGLNRAKKFDINITLQKYKKVLIENSISS